LLVIPAVCWAGIQSLFIRDWIQDQACLPVGGSGMTYVNNVPFLKGVFIKEAANGLDED